MIVTFFVLLCHLCHVAIKTATGNLGLLYVCNHLTRHEGNHVGINRDALYGFSSANMNN